MFKPVLGLEQQHNTIKQIYFWLKYIFSLLVYSHAAVNNNLHNLLNIIISVCKKKVWAKKFLKYQICKLMNWNRVGVGGNPKKRNFVLKRLN